MTSQSGVAQSPDEQVIKVAECNIKYVPREGSGKTKEKLKRVNDNPEESKIENWNISSDSKESITLDSLRSGESAFKIFTFDPKNDSDTQKCISFWNAIIQRNLQPIKAALIAKENEEVSKIESPTTIVEETLRSEGSSMGESDKFETPESKERQMWMKTFKAIEKRKLEQLKADLICAEQDALTCAKEKEKVDKRGIKELTSKHRTRSMSRSQISTATVEKVTILTPKSRDKSGSVKTSTSSKIAKSVKLPSQKRSSNLQKVKLAKPKRGVLSKKYSIQIIWNFEDPLAKHTLPPGICCECGCESETCGCEKYESLENVIWEKVEELVKEHECGCGCAEPDCVCEHADDPLPCSCGCGMAGCVCQDLEEQPKDCSCGCGAGNKCVCQDMMTLFGKSCMCGSLDCSCDEIAVLGMQIRAMENEKMKKFQMKNKHSQLAEMKYKKSLEGQNWWPMEVSKHAMRGKYCVICGLFNCKCDL